MKLKKYFVDLTCPWCKKSMGVVNSNNNESVLSAEICIICKSHLEIISKNIVFVIDDSWLEEDIQKNDIPIYPFVKGIILTTRAMPPVPHYRERYAILPVTIAKRFGLPQAVLAAMIESETPVVFDYDEDISPTNPLLMHVGNC